MTRRDIPPEAKAQPTLTRLAELTRITKTRPADIDYIQVAIERHLRIAREQDSMPDGYPTRSSGVSSGGGGHVIDPDTGESVPVTSVEAAYEARLQWRDVHDTNTAIAWGHIQVATYAIAAATQLLRKLDGEQTLPDGLGLEDDRWCVNHLRCGHPHEPRSADGGRHCRWCADFHRANGEYPNAELIEYRHRHGRLTDVVVRRYQPTAIKEATS